MLPHSLLERLVKNAWQDGLRTGGGYFYDVINDPKQHKRVIKNAVLTIRREERKHGL
jgi:hypothetical protein